MFQERPYCSNKLDETFETRFPVLQQMLVDEVDIRRTCQSNSGYFDPEQQYNASNECF